MPISSLLELNPTAGPQYDADTLTTTILEHLNEQTVISLDTLVCLMPQYSWNQIFHCVDQLSRNHKVVLRRHRFEYTLFSTNFLA